jgi:cell division protein ZapE
VTTPSIRYEADLAGGDFVDDPAQRAAVEALDALQAALQDQPPPATGLRGWWQRRRGAAPAAVPGLYLWGGVGRGKTYLMDTFYECLPASIPRRRVHFHRFMQSAHYRLRWLREQPDPLRTLAAEWAGEARVLCFDEFFVSDIADAMILSGLLHGLIDEGVTLVATSNLPPDGLYPGGLQRDRFLPAIDLLERHLQVMNVDGGTDYRLRLLSRAPVYHVPADAHARTALAETFERLSPERDHETDGLAINQRDIPVLALGDGVLWVRFGALCEGPRSADDYVEIARRFHTVLISDVPIMDRDREDAARRFAAMVDEFYDRGVKLIISATAEPEWLYRGRHLHFEFRRIISRLREMQSREYLALPHRP